jgi:hypothetical protein
MEKQGLVVNAKARHDSIARGETAAVQRARGRFFTVACASDVCITAPPIAGLSPSTCRTCPVTHARSPTASWSSRDRARPDLHDRVAHTLLPSMSSYGNAHASKTYASLTTERRFRCLASASSRVAKTPTTGEK